MSSNGPIDSGIACIIARELIETIMFMTAYSGAVVKSDLIDSTTKREFITWLGIAVFCGLICGGSFSLGVGFGLRSITEEYFEESVEVGMEGGEGWYINH